MGDSGDGSVIAERRGARTAAVVVLSAVVCWGSWFGGRPLSLACRMQSGTALRKAKTAAAGRLSSVVPTAARA